MTAPSKLVADRSGVYRTPGDPSELRARAAASGVQWLEADVANARDKAGLMQVLGRALAVPAGFGANWDALADSTQDLGWRSAQGYVLHLRHADRARDALGPEWTRLVEVLRASADAWRVRGKPFIAILDGAEDLAEWQ
jgi:hypothetical protein